MDQFIISQNVTPDHSAAFNVIAMGKMLFLLGTGCDANTLRWCELCFITITYLTDMTDIGSLTGSWEWCAIVTPSPGTGNTTWLFVQVRIKRVGHTAPHCSPPTIVPALVQGPGTVAPDTVYHVIISLSIVCFLIRQRGN